MSNQWARKYRPMDLDSYVGNLVIKKKVESMFKHNKVPHTLLFQGDRGCGKTTLARIMAKNISCKSPKENGLACEECAHCTKLNEEFISTGKQAMGIPVYEIDITKLNSKEDAAKLVEQMRQAPMRGQKKVYILDEVQRASPEAQNSYLKIAEEPGEHLYIILCTTDPEDLIDPLKSRFNALNVKRPTVQEIVDRLEYVCRDQNVKYDQASLRLIANHCKRVPRESLNKLEMVAIGGEVRYHLTVQELQSVSVELYQEYLQLLISDEDDIFRAMQFIEDLYEVHGVDHGDFLANMSEYLVDVFNMKVGIRLDKYSEDEYKHARKLMKSFQTHDIARMLGLLEEALRLKDNPQYALILFTLKMAYPNMLEPVPAKVVPSVVKNESRNGMNEYLHKTREHKIAKEQMRDKIEIGNEDDLMNLLPGIEQVDMSSFLDELDNLS